jgi:hypothetical protein
MSVIMREILLVRIRTRREGAPNRSKGITISRCGKGS